MLAPTLAVSEFAENALTAGTSQPNPGNPLSGLWDYIITTGQGIVEDVVELRRDDLVADLAGIDTGPESTQEQRPVLNEGRNTTVIPFGLSTGEAVGVAAGGLAAIVGIVLLVK